MDWINKPLGLAAHLVPTVTPDTPSAAQFASIPADVSSEADPYPPYPQALIEPVAPSVVDKAKSRTLGKTRLKVGIWLDRAIFAWLCFLAAVAPHFVHAGRFALKAVLLLWVIRFFVVPRKSEGQPLIVPMLAFLVLASLATAMSYVPVTSWWRIGWFAIIVIAALVAQNVRTLAQVRIIVVLVLASAAISVLITGWQYTYGIGTQLVVVPADSLLFKEGVRPGYIVTSLNGLRTSSPSQLRSAFEATRGEPRMRLDIVTSPPIAHYKFEMDREDLQEYLGLPEARLRRGHPARAQGDLYHYVPFAGELVQLALLAFGLLVLVPEKSKLTRLALLLLFVGLAASLYATETRAYAAVLFLGCAIQLCLARKRIRLAAMVLLAIGFIATVVWIQRSRGMAWLSPEDHYRFDAWKDSLRLVPRHPFFGVGPDSTLTYGDLWGMEAYKKYGFRSHFHSNYVQLAVDCGLPGLAAWLWLMIAYLFFLARSWLQSRDWDWFSRGVVLGVFGGAIGFVASGFLHYSLGDAEVMTLIWLFMGLAIAVARLGNLSSVEGVSP